MFGPTWYECMAVADFSLYLCADHYNRKKATKVKGQVVEGKESH